MILATRGIVRAVYRCFGAPVGRSAVARP